MELVKPEKSFEELIFTDPKAAKELLKKEIREELQKEFLDIWKVLKIHADRLAEVVFRNSKWK